jgi:hypothetical protein
MNDLLIVTILYLFVAGVVFVLLRVLVRTLSALKVSHGISVRHMILPSLLWPMTVMSLGLWLESDARMWWEPR